MFSCHVAGQEVAIKVLDSVDEILDEVEQEFVILRDLSNHDNIPRFYGLFLRQDPNQDQLWITMEVGKLFVFFLKLRKSE